MSQPTAPQISFNMPRGLKFGPTVLLQEKKQVTKNGNTTTTTTAASSYTFSSSSNGCDGSNGANGTKPSNGTNGATEPPPPLGVLERFTGTFSGSGYNTIFRPNSKRTPTKLEVQASDIDDNILQLNLIKETMAFMPSLGEVPNRGFEQQEDTFLNGVPYIQTIVDAMKELGPNEKTTVLHMEPGLWMHVPESKGNPVLPASLARMASIPHGTTINAQSFRPPVPSKGAPDIPAVSITPFQIGNEKKLIHDFTSHQADNNHVHRIPEDLTKWLNAKTITQTIINNPRTVLTNANKGKDIVDNVTFTVSTAPKAAELGGGTSNIGFLVGKPVPNRPGETTGNANAAKVEATYWISTVRVKITLKPFQPAHKDDFMRVSPTPLRPDDIIPTFRIYFAVPAARTVTVEYTQIQYSQTVLLDFGGLSWPHITVSTLAPVERELQPSDLK